MFMKFYENLKFAQQGSLSNIIKQNSVKFTVAKSADEVRKGPVYIQSCNY